MADRPVRILRRRGGGNGGGGKGSGGGGNSNEDNGFKKKRGHVVGNNDEKRQQRGSQESKRNIKFRANLTNTGISNSKSAEQVGTGERSVWVNPGSEFNDIVRSITGAAKPDARYGFPVHVKANFDSNTNTAIKAIINAQQRIWDDQSIAVGLFPIFRDNRTELNLKLVQLVDSPPFHARPELLDDAEDLSCSSNTNPTMLAGKLKHSIQSFNYVSTSAIGERAVFNLIKAICITREFLAESNEQDIVCFPDFIQVQLDGRSGPTTAIRFVIMLSPDTSN